MWILLVYRYWKVFQSNISTCKTFWTLLVLLDWINLLKPVCHPYIHLSTKVFWDLSDLNEIWFVDSRWWLLRDGMPYDLIQGQEGQGDETLELEILTLPKLVFSGFTVVAGKWLVCVCSVVAYNVVACVTGFTD